MDETQVVIIGAGVVGLSIAARLSEKISDIVVVERNDSFGRETSSRNSEVIHSGIYYPPHTMKAVLCREGASKLYDYCEKTNIPFRRTGKLIVATDDIETEELIRLANNAEANGMGHVESVDQQQIRSIEEEVIAVAGLYLPQTGIINSHALMSSLYQTAVSRNVIFAFNTDCTTLHQVKDGYIMGFRNDEYIIKARVVINSAGHQSDKIAALTGMDTEKLGYQIHLCKGSYFYYSQKSPITRLVYPVPHTNLTGLGIHATIDLGGRLRFGPDVEYVNTLNYDVAIDKKEQFYLSARKILRNIERDKISPDMAGIRPKLSGKGGAFRDFVISEESAKGFPGLINLIGIESPGLTSCLAIAEMVERMVNNVV